MTKPDSENRSVSAPEVHALYAARHRQHQEEAARLARLDRALSNRRLAAFALFLAVLWAGPVYDLYSPWWSLLPLALFIGLALWHNRALRLGDLAARAAAFYAQGLARLEDRWAGCGKHGARFADPAHPYAEHLDLFGGGSLFELLCTARTRAGEDRLAAWLLAPAEPAIVRARQQAVAELRPRLELREVLALLGEEVDSALAPELLSAWGAAPSVLPSGRLRGIAAALASLTAAALIAWAGGAGPIPLTIMLVVSQTFNGIMRRRVQEILRGLERPGHDLALLGLLLARMERERFNTPLLTTLRAGLEGAAHPPSARIAQLHRLIGHLHAQSNILFMPFAVLLLWETQLAFAIEAWRARNGALIDGWLNAVGEFEALCALAGYAFEHPDDPFPEIVETGRLFEGEGLAHPLLPLATVVRNDVRLNEETRLLIVSGSNMSGKSTLLRAIGVNTILALAGAPVRAARLRLAPLQVGASIRTLDSLREGVSRFYAEITRLRLIVDRAGGKIPLLFLLDEILHGTNSHDRRIGAEAVARDLLRRGSLGLLTTHDLALARIADEVALHAVNVHFEDHLETGKMTFDYRLRPGVVQKSNALELMRAVGLEV